MKIRYLLDGIIINETPDGWQKRITGVKLDRELKSRLVTEDATLEWFNDGYEYIKSKFDENICNEVKIEIQKDVEENGGWKTDFKGLIKMPDCKFSIAPFGVKTAVVDDGFYARIKNNKSIKTTMNNARSKNDVAISIPTRRTVKFFNPANGTYSYTGRQGYFIDDLFRYMISFISDDEVGYISETFGFTGLGGSIPGEYARFAIFLGIDIRIGALNTDKFMELDFATLYKEVDKKFNIGFRMEYLNGKPTMRIEKASWFYKSANTARFDNIRNITRSVDSEYLYSTINPGSTITQDIGAFPEQTRYFGFRDEQFYLFGQCNIDRNLDLKSNWIISHNVIKDVVVDNDDSHDDDVFMVQVYGAAYDFAFQSNWFVTAPPYYYNELLQNRYVIERWLDGIPRTVVAQLGVGNHRFSAQHTAAQPLQIVFSPNPGGITVNTTTSPYKFDNDFTGGFFDSSNQYGNGTTQGTPVTAANSRFTAPGAGIYTFDVNIPLRVDHADNNFTIYREIRLKRFNSSNVLISTDTVGQSLGHPAPGFYDIHLTKSIVLNSADYVIVETLFRVFTNVYFPGSYTQYQEIAGATFTCTYASVDEGGEYSIVDITNQRFMKYAAQKVPCTDAVVDSILADTTGSILINHDGHSNFTGWIDEIKIDRFNRRADLSLIGRRIDEPIIK